MGKEKGPQSGGGSSESALVYGAQTRELPKKKKKAQNSRLYVITQIE